MLTTSRTLVAVAASAFVGCGGYPVPNDRLATSQAAVRGAEEVGVGNEPTAALHLKLAQEQVAQAKVLIRDGEHKRADYVLMRASSEAELALSLSRAATARAEAQAVLDQTEALRQAKQ